MKLTKKDFIKEYGFKKLKGYRLELDELPSTSYCEYYYFQKDTFKDIIKVMSYWQGKDSEEVFEDINEVIDYIEDWHDITFEGWKSRKIPYTQKILGKLKNKSCQPKDGEK